jgi:hypothetical protein
MGNRHFPGGPLVNPLTHYFDTFEQDQFSVELQLSGSAIETD